MCDLISSQIFNQFILCITIINNISQKPLRIYFEYIINYFYNFITFSIYSPNKKIMYSFYLTSL